ncbi:hypothetical protein FQZ97_671770 [compost metagenome]
MRGPGREGAGTDPGRAPGQRQPGDRARAGAPPGRSRHHGRPGSGGRAGGLQVPPPVRRNDKCRRPGQRAPRARGAGAAARLARCRHAHLAGLRARDGLAPDSRHAPLGDGRPGPRDELVRAVHARHPGAVRSGPALLSQGRAGVAARRPRHELAGLGRHGGGLRLFGGRDLRARRAAAGHRQRLLRSRRGHRDPDPARARARGARQGAHLAGDQAAGRASGQDRARRAQRRHCRDCARPGDHR